MIYENYYVKYMYMMRVIENAMDKKFNAAACDEQRLHKIALNY